VPPPPREEREGKIRVAVVVQGNDMVSSEKQAFLIREGKGEYAEPPLGGGKISLAM